MKKSFLVAGLVLVSAGAFAQTNLQLFYDFGDNRKYVTSTLEMFKADDWGNTFFFVDYDYANNDNRDNKIYGATGSYFEIARSLNFWQDSNYGALSAHVEFNSGVNFNSRNWLFGAEYLIHSADYANTLTLELLFKTFCNGKKSDVPIQFTTVWGMKDIFGVEGLNFSGFFDIWGQKVVNEGKESDFVFISEPQLWYNVGKYFGCNNFNVGTEVELGVNFGGYDGFKAFPCLGAKWDF